MGSSIPEFALQVPLSKDVPVIFSPAIWTYPLSPPDTPEASYCLNLSCVIDIVANAAQCSRAGICQDCIGRFKPSWGWEPGLLPESIKWRKQVQRTIANGSPPFSPIWLVPSQLVSSVILRLFSTCWIYLWHLMSPLCYETYQEVRYNHASGPTVFIASRICGALPSHPRLSWNTFKNLFIMHTPSTCPFSRGILFGLSCTGRLAGGFEWSCMISYCHCCDGA